MTIPAVLLADELGVPEADVLALVDQLIALDGHEAVVVDGHITPDAQATIRRQITAAPGTAVTDIIATVDRPDPADDRGDWNWAEEATAAWLAEATRSGVTIQAEDHEVYDGYTAAKVQVGSEWFALELRDDDVVRAVEAN